MTKIMVAIFYTMVISVIPSLPDQTRLNLVRKIKWLPYLKKMELYQKKIYALSLTKMQLNTAFNNKWIRRIIFNSINLWLTRTKIIKSCFR